MTRVGCDSCGTEIAGVFEACSFCALDDAELAMLRVFLASRGNLREVEKHLGVSYPTARQRFAELLDKLGLVEETVEPARTAEDILGDVAAGKMSSEQAERLLNLL